MKKLYIIIIAIFIAIQFYRPASNSNPVIVSHTISSVALVPENVNTIFKKACYDCHSNNTTYPWYSYVQPVGLWLNSHINDGKKHLNFDEFATYRLRKQYHKLEEIIDEVKGKEMPLKSYVLIHNDANLSIAERVTLTNWASNVMDSMKAVYPMDSLMKPKS
ncbi:MAG: heme-binding domain-containing protein [Chitinophagaceae bacterium]|nr:heme-binding domain-containing protein [Chitinophagaceae bacterium]